MRLILDHLVFAGKGHDRTIRDIRSAEGRCLRKTPARRSKTSGSGFLLSPVDVQRRNTNAGQLGVQWASSGWLGRPFVILGAGTTYNRRAFVSKRSIQILLWVLLSTSALKAQAAPDDGLFQGYN